MIDTIILAAKYNSDVNIYDPLMEPIHGKPAIEYVISNLQDISKTVVVVNKHNIRLQQYLANAHPFLKQGILDPQEEEEKYGMHSILNSLYKGLYFVDQKVKIVKVILGDTVCRLSELPELDIVLTSMDFDVSERWCLVELDEKNRITKFYDKEKLVDVQGKHALVGYYQFSNIETLKEIVKSNLAVKRCNISDVLMEYGNKFSLKAVEVKNWYDLGHRSGVVKAQNAFFNSREFNSLYVDAIHGTITKISSKMQKLEDENYWYKNLPSEIQPLVPRVFSFKKNINNAVLTMELYGYQALSELFILGNMTLEEWKLILCRLFQTHNLLKKHTGSVCLDEFKELYFTKTVNRMEELKQQNPYWENLYSYKKVYINDVEYKNISSFESLVLDRIQKLVDTPVICIMHGDFCLSNILFDTNNFVCKMIDPRGRLKSQGILGDGRYDIAKLRHSIVGKYDYVVNGLYKLQENGNRFVYVEATSDNQDKLSSYFDELIVENGFVLDDIKFIEALLFMSMIPLHKDSLDRQKAFYLKAVMKLNEIFGEKNYEQKITYMY